MKRNMGAADRIIRMLIAALIAYLYYSKILTGMLGVGLLVIGGVFLVTGFIGLCPLYSLLGINSCRTKKEQL